MDAALLLTGPPAAALSESASASLVQGLLIQWTRGGRAREAQAMAHLFVVGGASGMNRTVGGGGGM
jgi:hypothetical protein